MLEALQGSWLAHTIGESQMLTASLSSLHLIGFTLVMGSALVSNLRMTGVLLPERPASDVTDPAARVVLIGLAISAATGLLLFVPRAEGAAANSTFRVKLTLLALAVLVHFVAQLRVARDADAGRGIATLVGLLGIALWMGVALAGCAFILLE
jgi:hypothetical protein